MSEPQYILLEDWANAKFNPVPSKHTLWGLARTGRIEPAPQLVGRNYYVNPDAKLREEPERTLVGRLKKRHRTTA